MGKQSVDFKLSSAIKQMGRPMTYYPSLARIIGLKESIFLCQLIYWTPRTHGDEGWLYKSVEEMEEETGLSYKEQMRIRKSLIGKKLMEENYARDEHRLFFRISVEQIDKLGEHMTNEHMLKGQLASDQRSDGILPKVRSIKSSSTEITTETTTKNLVESQKQDSTDLFGNPENQPIEHSKKQKPEADHRHRRFMELVVEAHKHFVKVPPFIDGVTGVNLAKLLKARPDIDEKKFRTMLKNYHNSDDHARAENPRRYILMLPKYELGSLDQFSREPQVKGTGIGYATA